MKITLQRWRQHCVIYPPLPALAEEFYTLKHAPADDDTHGYNLDTRRISLIKPAEHADLHIPCQTCYAGLESLVTKWLRSRGYTVGLAGSRPKRLKQPKPKMLDECKLTDCQMLDFLRQRDRGMVRYTPGVKPHKLISQICSAWPRTKIMVWVTRIKDATHIAKQLRRAGLETTVLTGQHAPDAHAEPEGRIVISTYMALNDGLAGLEHRGIAIVLDPHEFVRSKWLEQLQIMDRAQKARLWGFLPADKQLAPYDRDMLTAVFGMQEMRLLRHGEVWIPPTAVFSPIIGGQPLEDFASTFALKQKGIWHNHLRNRRIAKLANAISQYDVSVLQRDFRNVYQQLNPQRYSPLGIVVENVEHGLQLAGLLPDWQLIADYDVNADGLSLTQRKALLRGQACACWMGESRILTDLALESLQEYNVIIRADGGTGLLCDDSGHYKYAFANYSGSLLIDFIDQQHPLLQKRTRQRQQAYRAAGWNIGDWETDELQAFMASRYRDIQQQQVAAG